MICKYSGCTGLKSATICNGEIGVEAFCFCGGLTSLTLGNGVTSIDEGAFMGCLALPSLTIPSSVTTISYAAFNCCTSLTSVTIPSSLANLCDKIFLGCTNLASITIPESVSEIGEFAFSECGNLTDVSCMAVNVPATDNNAFKDSPIASATLHVPAASIEAYRTTAPWSEFGTIVPITATGIANVENAKGVSIYDLQGRKVANPRRGIYIKNGKEVLIE